jgi:hypothetical protein
MINSVCKSQRAAILVRAAGAALGIASTFEVGGVLESNAI